MAWGLPDLKGALTGFYQESIQPTLENKTQEFKTIVQENFARGANTQQAIIVILLAVFLLLALAFFWPDKPGIQWKYFCLGTLIAFTTRYVLALKPYEFAQELTQK